MDSASQEGAIGRSVDQEGRLICPECNDVYDAYAVAQSGGPVHVFNALSALRQKAQIDRALQAGLQDQERQLREEFARIQQIQVGGCASESSERGCFVLCCAVLCCAVLCCAVLCSAVQCSAVLFR